MSTGRLVGQAVWTRKKRRDTGADETVESRLGEDRTRQQAGSRDTHSFGSEYPRMLTWKDPIWRGRLVTKKGRKDCSRRDRKGSGNLMGPRTRRWRVGREVGKVEVKL